MELIIAEKPSAAFDIAHVVGARDKKNGFIEGPNHIVTWCLGHIVQLAEPQTYNDAWRTWSLNSLPMLPEPFQLQATDDTHKQWTVVSELLHDKRFDSVVNACDAGREGELIFRNVYDLSGSTIPMKRLWLDDLTPEGVKKAIKNIRPGSEYDNLADAARARSEADWLVGLNATRAMTLKAGGQTLLSVGRVQTPTLALIVERNRTIQNFTPVSFWQVYATFADDAGHSWEAKHLRETGEDRFDDEPLAMKVITEVDKKQGAVTKVERVETNSLAPKLYDLTTLQREMNKRFGLSAQRTLDCAQALYATHKLLTYPRTSSRYLPETIRGTLQERVEALSDGTFGTFAQQALEHGLDLGKRFIDDKVVTDHHALIPTATTAASVQTLHPDEQCVYESVVRRFLAAFYPNARFAKSKVHTRVADHLFEVTGTIRLEEGWQIVDPPTKKSSKNTELPPIVDGAVVTVDAARLHRGKTTPPKQHDEASLLGAMETAGREIEDEEARETMKESGLGTDATRAGIIETLIARDYIVRDKKHLLPTTLGTELIDAIADDSLKSPELTGRWEMALNYIASGKLKRSDFMKQVAQLTAQIIKNIKTQPLSLPSAQPDSLGECPLCKARVFAGKKAYSCATGRDCPFVIFKKVAGKTITETQATQLLSGETTAKLKGFKSKKGSKFSAKLKLNPEGKVDLVFDD